jgi:hypothetical protein
MLFLAVFCGFLAENFREGQVEHHVKAIYVFNAQDLRADIIEIRFKSFTRPASRSLRQCDLHIK